MKPEYVGPLASMRFTEQGCDRVTFYKINLIVRCAGQMGGGERLVASLAVHAWADKLGMYYGGSDENRENVMKTGETSKKAWVPLRKWLTLFFPCWPDPKKMSHFSHLDLNGDTPDRNWKEGEPCAGSERVWSGEWWKCTFRRVLGWQWTLPIVCKVKQIRV